MGKTSVALGSVSHGTMRPEDLIPRFFDVLEQADKSRAESLEGDYPDILGPDAEDAEVWEQEDMDCCLDDLFNALDMVAPPFTHFGAHEGDGSDYGFWLSTESLEDAADDGTVVKVPAGDIWPIQGDECEYVLEVNDHGNCTLYTLDGTEVWAVV